MLLPSTKVVAKKLLILSKTGHDAKSTWEEGAKARKMDTLQKTQNLIPVHIHWIKEELIIYIKSVGHFHSNRKEFNLSPTSWVSAPFIILLAIMRTASSLKRKKHM